MNAPPSLKLGNTNAGGRDKTPPRKTVNLTINTGVGVAAGIAPPSRVFHQRTNPDKSPVKVRYGDYNTAHGHGHGHGHGHAHSGFGWRQNNYNRNNNSSTSSNNNTRENPSPLRQRASGLNLAPIDTSFGNSGFGDRIGGGVYGNKGNKSDYDDGSRGGTAIHSDGSDPSSPPPTDPNTSGNFNKDHSDHLSLVGVSPSPVNSTGKHKFPFSSEHVNEDMEDSNALDTNNVPSTNNDSTESLPPTQLNQNTPGVTTLTSFKRPHSKVGIVFTRRSRSSPDTCVISKIMPDSIFSNHEQRYAREGETLQGAEVIAVNGIPVREARHAAELVAGCGEEVRLTVRRVGVVQRNVQADAVTNAAIGDSAHICEDIAEEKTDDDEVPESPKKSPPPMPQSMPPSLADNVQVNKTISFDDEESDLSVKTDPDPDGALPEETEEGGGENDMEADQQREMDQKAQQQLKHEHQEPQQQQLEQQKTPQQEHIEEQQHWSNPKSTTSQDIIERRRKIAQAMLMSSEMVEDPFPSSPLKFFGEDDGNIDRNHSDDENDLAIVKKQFNDPVVKSAVEKSPVATPSSSRVAGSASAIERRRLTAMKMYQSPEMVADNVDDVRLGTVDVIGYETKATIDGMTSSFPSNKTLSQIDHGDNASVATTNVTTSSSATQRMGSSPHNNTKEFFGEDVFSPKSAPGFVSPVAQRRKERTMQRLSKSNSMKGSDGSSPTAVARVDVSPPPLKSPPPFDSKEMRISKSVSSVSSSSQMKRNKTDDESVAATSIAASSVAASSTAAFSDVSGDSRGSRSLFGKKKRQSIGSTVAQTVPLKKKSSIFGVANLIRKASVSLTACSCQK